MTRNHPVLLLLAAGLAAQLRAATPETNRAVRCTFAAIPPRHRAVAVFDALNVGRDGAVYFGTSNYGTPARLVRYDPVSGAVEVVCDVSATQSEDLGQFVPSGKIHTLLPVASDGTIYFGTHLGDDRCMSGEHPSLYGGGHFMSYNPATRQCRDLGRASGQESVMRVELDEPRQRLYGITYPGGRLIVKDLVSGAITDKGQASHHGYAMPYLFADGRAYFFSRPGKIARYDPDTDAIEEVLTLPPTPNQAAIDANGLYSSMLRGLNADRTAAVGSVGAGKQRFLYRFTVPPDRAGACDFHWLGEVPLEASSTLLAPNGDILAYAWRSCRIHYFETASGAVHCLGVPRDAEGRAATLIFPAVFAPDGTLYFGGALDTTTDRFKQSGYGLGALGFIRIAPEALQHALNEAKP
jgi:outer membrane protein assembly factor BamB